MMRVEPLGMARRALALALLGGLILLIYGLLLAPLLDVRRSAYDALAQLEQQVQVFAGLAAQKAQLDISVSTMTKSMVAAGVLAEAADRSMSQATALNAISQLATQHGLQLTSSESEAIQVEQGLVKLPITIRAAGSDGALSGFLAAIADQRPLMVLDSLRLGRNDIGVEGVTPTLNAELRIVALAREAP